MTNAPRAIELRNALASIETMAHALSEPVPVIHWPIGSWVVIEGDPIGWVMGCRWQCGHCRAFVDADTFHGCNPPTAAPAR